MPQNRPLPPLIRKGMPSSCIVCGGNLHRKSDHYCSLPCEATYKAKNQDAPRFLSKWKLRKMKYLNDPLAEVRHWARQKTRKLIIEGRLKKGSCVVCGSSEVIAHHENYDRPADVIWMCDSHHKAYHDGKIGLFDNKLWWNPSRLIPRRFREHAKTEKYLLLKREFKKNKRKTGR